MRRMVFGLNGKQCSTGIQVIFTFIHIALLYISYLHIETLIY